MRETGTGQQVAQLNEICDDDEEEEDEEEEIKINNIYNAMLIIYGI